MAELLININKLKSNIKNVKKICDEHHLELVGIIKGLYGFSPIIQAFQDGGIELLGISRMEIGRKLSSNLKKSPLLISLPSKANIEQIPRFFHCSLNSEISTIKALGEAAKCISTIHGVILMIDNGDLREGMMPEEVFPAIKEILSWKNKYLDITGIGANLACCSGTLPDHENIEILSQIAGDVEQKLNFQIKKISVGGSVMLDWISKHPMPKGINQVRIGEAILLGNIPTINKKHQDLHDNAFTFRGEIIELKTKPSLPSGRQGKEAFGKTIIFKDKGLRKRALLNFGIVDTDPFGLTARIANIEFINSNSDYTIVDVTDCDVNLKKGDVLEFDLNYRSLIQTLLSPFVNIHLLHP